MTRATTNTESMHTLARPSSLRCWSSCWSRSRVRDRFPVALLLGYRTFKRQHRALPSPVRRLSDTNVVERVRYARRGAAVASESQKRRRGVFRLCGVKIRRTFARERKETEFELLKWNGGKKRKLLCVSHVEAKRYPETSWRRRERKQLGAKLKRCERNYGVGAFYLGDSRRTVFDGRLWFPSRRYAQGQQQM